MSYPNQYPYYPNHNMPVYPFPPPFHGHSQPGGFPPPAGLLPPPSAPPVPLFQAYHSSASMPAPIPPYPAPHVTMPPPIQSPLPDSSQPYAGIQPQLRRKFEAPKQTRDGESDLLAAIEARPYVRKSARGAAEKSEEIAEKSEARQVCLSAICPSGRSGTEVLLTLSDNDGSESEEEEDGEEALAPQPSTTLSHVREKLATTTDQQKQKQQQSSTLESVEDDSENENEQSNISAEQQELASMSLPFSFGRGGFDAPKSDSSMRKRRRDGARTEEEKGGEKAGGGSVDHVAAIRAKLMAESRKLTKHEKKVANRDPTIMAKIRAPVFISSKVGQGLDASAVKKSQDLHMKKLIGTKYHVVSKAMEEATREQKRKKKSAASGEKKH